MDGVERVMVLGILAVIVAILSFAWSATDESTAPVGALDRNSGMGGVAVPLSSNTSSGGSVPIVLDDKDRDRINERMSANKSARENQKKRLEFMTEGQAGPLGEPGADPTQGGTAFAPDDSERAGGQPSDQPVVVVKPSTRVPLKPEAAQNEGSDDASDAPDYRYYTLEEGDTLWGIARRTVGTSGGDINQMVALVQELNPELVATSMSAGRTIKLPAASVEAPTSVFLTPSPDLPLPTPDDRAQQGAGRMYIVGEGESLSTIAEFELGDRSRWQEIYQLNRAIIPDPDRIREGQRLKLPAD